jgi:hypothetical protein
MCVVVVESKDGFVAGEKISLGLASQPKKAPLPRQDQDDTLPGQLFFCLFSKIQFQAQNQYSQSGT